MTCLPFLALALGLAARAVQLVQTAMEARFALLLVAALANESARFGALILVNLRRARRHSSEASQAALHYRFSKD